MAAKHGRPTKLTPECQKTICDAISAGVPIQVAAALGGVSQTQFYVWVKKHSEFAEAIKKAAATAETRLVGIIAKAASKQWTAAAWILERHPKYRERWAKISDRGIHQNLTISSPDTKAA
jgi:transposase